MYYQQALSKKLSFFKPLFGSQLSLKYSFVLLSPNYKPSEYKMLLKYFKTFGLQVHGISNKKTRFWFGSNIVLLAGTYSPQLFFDCASSFKLYEGNRVTLPFVVLGQNCCTYNFLTKEIVPSLYLSQRNLFYTILIFSNKLYDAHIPAITRILTKA